MRPPDHVLAVCGNAARADAYLPQLTAAGMQQPERQIPVMRPFMSDQAIRVRSRFSRPACGRPRLPALISSGHSALYGLSAAHSLHLPASRDQAGQGGRDAEGAITGQKLPVVNDAEQQSLACREVVPPDLS